MTHRLFEFVEEKKPLFDPVVILKTFSIAALFVAVAVIFYLIWE